MEKPTKTDQVAIQLATELSNNIVFDSYRSVYRRVRRGLVEYSVKHSGALDFEPSSGIWRNAWRIVMDRMRHADAAREAVNWTKRSGNSESRTEISIIDEFKVKQVADKLAAGSPEYEWPLQPNTPLAKLAVAILLTLNQPKTKSIEVDGATFINEADIEANVKSEFRIDYSANLWPEAWKQVVTLLESKDAVAREVTDKTSPISKRLSQSIKLILINDASKIHDLVQDPTTLIKPLNSASMTAPTLAKHKKYKSADVPSTPTKETLNPVVFSKWGYARVTTELDSADQYIQQLSNAGAENLVIERLSAKASAQPKWHVLITQVKPGDTIFVPEMLRLSPSLSAIAEVIQELIRKKVNLTLLDCGKLIEFDETGNLTPTSNAMVKTLAATAKLNREVLVERTKAGRTDANKRPQQYQVGRKPVVAGDRLAEMLAYYENHTVRETIAKYGVSESTLMRRVREDRMNV